MTTTVEIMTELGNLVRRWERGWALARGLGPAEEARGALHVPVHDEDRHTEVVVLDAGSIAALAAEVAAAPVTNWLTVPTTDADSVLRIFTDAGLKLHQRECFMSTNLNNHPSHKAPADYTVTTTFADGLIQARIEHSNGDLAARGVMSVIGADAAAHNIVTLPDHRRRGLASALMSALADEAVARGATTGLLVASADGERLYTSLGWHRHAGVLVGVK